MASSIRDKFRDVKKNIKKKAVGSYKKVDPWDWEKGEKRSIKKGTAIGAGLGAGLGAVGGVRGAATGALIGGSVGAASTAIPRMSRIRREADVYRVTQQRKAARKAARKSKFKESKDSRLQRIKNKVKKASPTAKIAAGGAIAGGLAGGSMPFPSKRMRLKYAALGAAGGAIAGAAGSKLGENLKKNQMALRGKGIHKIMAAQEKWKKRERNPKRLYSKKYRQDLKRMKQQSMKGV